MAEDSFNSSKNPQRIDVAPSIDSVDKAWQAQIFFIKKHKWFQLLIVAFILFSILFAYFVLSEINTTKKEVENKRIEIQNEFNQENNRNVAK
ncbi:MAG: hypothetical protein HYT83_03315 [Candidatus Levybacteria bacterium]|nr:hypothetical protein [Candidatus Levybacteria bacterium]